MHAGNGIHAWLNVLGVGPKLQDSNSALGEQVSLKNGRSRHQTGFVLQSMQTPKCQKAPAEKGKLAGRHMRVCCQHLQVAVEHAEGRGHGPDEYWHRFTAPLHPGVCKAAPGVVHQEHGKQQHLIRRMLSSL